MTEDSTSVTEEDLHAKHGAEKATCPECGTTFEDGFDCPSCGWHDTAHCDLGGSCRDYVCQEAYAQDRADEIQDHRGC